MDLKQSEIIELLIVALPYPHLIKDINLDHPNAVYFSWYGTKYKVENGLKAYLVEDGMISGSASAILLEKLLKTYYNQ